LGEPEGDAEVSALVFFLVEVLDVPAFLVVDFLAVDSVVDAAVVLVVSFF
jgi:hypothetical protein